MPSAPVLSEIPERTFTVRDLHSALDEIFKNRNVEVTSGSKRIYPPTQKPPSNYEANRAVKSYIGEDKGVFQVKEKQPDGSKEVVFRSVAGAVEIDNQNLARSLTGSFTNTAARNQYSSLLEQHPQYDPQAMADLKAAAPEIQRTADRMVTEMATDAGLSPAAYNKVIGEGSPVIAALEGDLVAQSGYYTDRSSEFASQAVELPQPIELEVVAPSPILEEAQPIQEMEPLATTEAVSEAVTDTPAEAPEGESEAQPQPQPESDESLQARIDGLEAQISQLTSQFQSLQTTVKEVAKRSENKLPSVREWASQAKTKVEAMQSRITSASKNLVAGGRVMGERALDRHQQALASLGEKILGTKDINHALASTLREKGTETAAGITAKQGDYTITAKNGTMAVNHAERGKVYQVNPNGSTDFISKKSADLGALTDLAKSVKAQEAAAPKQEQKKVVALKA